VIFPDFTAGYTQTFQQSMQKEQVFSVLQPTDIVMIFLLTAFCRNSITLFHGWPKSAAVMSLFSSAFFCPF
jgi:hypothetical protein